MQKRFFVNSILVAAGVAAAVGLVSCVSATKGDRGVANLEAVSTDAEVEQIALQGVPAQAMRNAKGKWVEVLNKPFRPKTLDEGYLKELAGEGGQLKVSSAFFITDNDLALRKKLDVIKKAKKTLKLVYFIWAEDYTSSALMTELLKAANGPDKVKVEIIVDLITNYKKLDLFKALYDESGGRIQTYFYNFPSQQMVRDANYMTLPCPKDQKPCHDFKNKIMAQLPADKLTPFGKLFLSGIYGRSAAAMKAAVGLGAQINPADYKSQLAAGGEEDPEAMLDLAKLVLGALKGNFLDKIKLSIAMSMYGEKIEPILNELKGRFPAGLEDGSADSAKMWDHFSDYVHHKLVLADNTELVMGGRNIEDSYHVDERIKGARNKYLFDDTDIWMRADLKANPKGFDWIAGRYNDMKTSTMVASMQTVEKHLDYEFVMNTGKSKTDVGSSQRAMFVCLENVKGGKLPPAELGECILGQARNPALGYESYETRKAAVLKTIDEHAAVYKTHSKRSDNELSQMSKKDRESAKFYYLENLSVERGNNQKRLKGSVFGFEKENNKNIHAAWYRGLEGACVESQRQEAGKYVYSQANPVRVIFNTAYLIMPSGLVHKIGQMMNNDFGNCSRVKITFITNSPYTSDLAPINILAKYQLGVLFDHYKQLENNKAVYEQPVKREDSGNYTRYVPAQAGDKDAVRFKYDSFWPTLEYYEMAPADYESAIAMKEKPDSLHTKVTLIGRDLIVGSANADFRSYFMDTNNAMLIRDAHEMNAEYVKYIDGLISKGRIINKMDSFTGRSFAVLRAENQKALDVFANKYNQQKRMDRFGETILNLLDDAGGKIYFTSEDLLTPSRKYDKAKAESIDGRDDSRWPLTKKLNEDANSMDNLFKVF